MPYIIVRSKMYQEAADAFQGSTTYIQYHAEYNVEGTSEFRILEDAMSHLNAARCFIRQGGHVVRDNRDPFGTYQTNKPPYLVLNRLEIDAGYKVVASNTITDFQSDRCGGRSSHTQIWTLHKQA